MRALFCSLLVAAATAQSSPRHVVFTWQGDTGTTLTVNFQTLGPKPPAAVVHWDTEARDAVLDAYRHSATGSSSQIEGLPDRWLHRVELRDLEPGATIHLVAGDAVHGISRELHVRTIPHDDRPLRFVVGGDMGPSADTRTLLHQAAARAPDFALLGGDIAYADGRVHNVHRWETWLDYWCEEMVTPDGRAIPVAIAIGNHEVRGGWAQPPSHAPFWFTLFGQDEHSYFARRFGANLAVLLLDTGHISPHAGAQAEWIDRTLASFAEVRHTIAVYHVPLYPSHREFLDSDATPGREHWAPLFDRHHLDIAFEHHDHTWKRTPRLRGGKLDPDGTLYLGDGCFGRIPRAVVYGGRWYLERHGSIQHFWCVDVDRDGMTCRAIDKQGRTFDVWPENTEDAAAAARVLAEHPPTFRTPDGSFEVTAMPMPGPQWQQGEVEVRFTNHLPAPCRLSVAFGSGPARTTAECGAPRIDGVDVDAVPVGATATVRVALAAPAAVARADLQLRLRATVVFAADGQPVEIQELLTVPLSK